MTVTGPASATPGSTAALNLSWSGLAAGQKYLGAIDYNEGPTTHATTIVGIDN